MLHISHELTIPHQTDQQSDRKLVVGDVVVVVYNKMQIQWQTEGAVFILLNMNMKYSRNIFIISYIRQCND